MLCEAAQHLEQQLNSPCFGEHSGTYQADTHTFGIPDLQENQDRAALLVGHLLQGPSLIQTSVMGLKNTFSFDTSLVSLSHPGAQSETEISFLYISFALVKLSNSNSFACPHIPLWRWQPQCW